MFVNAAVSFSPRASPSISGSVIMAAEKKTYLELSHEAGAQKFYETTVKGKRLTLRYGRVGTQGQTSVTTFRSPTAAKAQAEKKILEKLGKGYKFAEPGSPPEPAKKRREARSKPRQAPVLWKFATRSPAFGISIDATRCWVGNEEGQVYCLDHQGEVLNQFRFPEGVKCIVADDVWFYAGCNDGNVYDLTRRSPRLAYTISKDVNIFWLDICDGILVVSDEGGTVAAIDPEDQLLWKKKSRGDDGWMVRRDQRAVYHGHSGGVTAYALDSGDRRWHQKAAADVQFGWQTAQALYVGTVHDKVHCLDKNSGKELAVYECDDEVFSCAVSTDEKHVFAGDMVSWVYCFAATGERLWKLRTGCGEALSMQFWKDRLYIVTRGGYLACIDATEAAIKAAQEGSVPKTRSIAAPKRAAAVDDTLETTTDASEGVVVECYKEGSKMRVRVVSPGYRKTWHVQFPKDIREEGARYVVEGVRKASRGGFYRAFGEIKKLVPAESAPAGGESAPLPSRRRR
jgi:predicted DNA-binding WGR domain protein